jgi:hypothetical protein
LLSPATKAAAVCSKKSLGQMEGQATAMA